MVKLNAILVMIILFFTGCKKEGYVGPEIPKPKFVKVRYRILESKENPKSKRIVQIQEDGRLQTYKTIGAFEKTVIVPVENGTFTCLILWESAEFEKKHRKGLWTGEEITVYDLTPQGETKTSGGTCPTLNGSCAWIKKLQ